MFSLAYLQISVTSLAISRTYCDYCKLTWYDKILDMQIVFVWY